MRASDGGFQNAVPELTAFSLYPEQTFNGGGGMSALGQKQTYAVQQTMSALHPIATMKADIGKLSCPLYPQKRTCAVHAPMSAMGQKRTWPYSITSSARASSVGGSVMPSAFAVVRLMTNSNLVGCSTGMSPGFVPRRILSTNSAVCRNRTG